MPADFDIYGVYVPRLLVLMVLTLAVTIVLRRALSWSGAYALVWHRGLFDIALYVLVLGALSYSIRWISS